MTPKAPVPYADRRVPSRRATSAPCHGPRSIRPWVVASGAGHQSTCSAKAAKIGNSQSTTLEITMDCDDGWVYFWLKTSCEPSWDLLRFFVDGTKKDEWSGENDWQRVGIPGCRWKAQVHLDVQQGQRGFAGRRHRLDRRHRVPTVVNL